MPAECFATRIALDALSAGVPGADVTLGTQHVDRVVDDALHEQSKLFVGDIQLFAALASALSQYLVSRAQLLFGLLPKRYLALRRLIETRVVDCDRRISRNPGHQTFDARIEAGCFCVAKEQTTQHFT